MRRVVCLVTLLAASAHAQPGDWSELVPSVGVSVPLAEGFGPDWTAGTGAAARLDLPAYRGRVRAALGVARYPANREDTALPDFSMVSATLGWGPDRALGRLRVAAGAQVGAVLFRFDRVNDGTFENVTETEAAVGAWARLSLPLASRLRVWAEAETLRLALAEPTYVTTASAGLAVRLDTPGWLREALR